MKNLNNLKLFLIMMIGTIAILSYGCSKNESDFGKITTIENHDIFRPEKSEVIDLITAFNDNYHLFKTGAKNSHSYSLSEAIWLLEAGVNYEFRSNKDSLSFFKTDTLKTTLNLFIDNTGQHFITSNNVFDVYTEFLIFSEGLTDENKKFILSDLVVESISGNEAEVFMMTTIGTIKPRQCFVQDDDYWYSAGLNGQCGIYQGISIGMDAGTRLNELINAKRCALIGCLGVVFYTDLEMKEYFVDDNGDPYFWYGNSSLECMEPDDIEIWHDYIELFLLSEVPPGKVLIRVDYFSEFSYANNRFFHACIAYFGVLNCSGSIG